MIPDGGPIPEGPSQRRSALVALAVIVVVMVALGVLVSID